MPLSFAPDARVERINRLYAARNTFLRASLQQTVRQELMQMICKCLVDDGGLQMVWIGWWVPENNGLVPVADYGDINGYLANIRVSVDDSIDGQGPSGLAFREGKPFISNDIANDPKFMRWKAPAESSSFKASAAFPISMKDKMCGTLNLYSDQIDFFDQEEIELLSEAALDISFALDSFAGQEDLQNALAIARREELLSEKIIESMPGIVYLYNEQGRFLRWNKNFETVTGYSGDEIPGMHPNAFFAGEDRDQIQNRRGEVFARGSSTLEASVVSRDGRSTPYYFTGQRLEFQGMTSLLGVGTDISAIKQAQSTIEESEKRYRTTLDSMIEGCQLIGFDWRYIYVNGAAARQNKRPIADLLGRTMQDAWPGIEHSTAFAVISRCMQERIPVHEEVLFEFPDGSAGWFELLVQPVPEGAFILSIDRTERHTAEMAMQELNASLEGKVAERTSELAVALDRAESADRAKSAFLATMSHELRTPLNSIIGFSGILMQELPGPLNAEQTKQLGMVQSSARHLLELVNDVLDISKIEAGELEVSLQPFDPRPALEKVVALLTPMAKSKGLAIVLSIKDIPAVIVSDQRRFEQILINLLNNAIKFTDHGSVEIAVDVEKESTTASSVSRIRICVSDSGIGIKAEDIETLFQPFHQIDSGLTRQHEGTGLGLAICRRLLDLLGGRISIESRWGWGSKFTILLPCDGGQ